MVITQPTEKEILLAQLEPWEWTPCVVRYPSIEDYIYKNQHEEANDLDDIWLGEQEVHIYHNRQKTFVKWRKEGLDGAGVLKKEELVEAKIRDSCAVCKRLQYQMHLWVQRLEIKCFHKEREHWGREKLTKMSVKTLMAIAIAGVQVPRKIMYVGYIPWPQVMRRICTKRCGVLWSGKTGM